MLRLNIGEDNLLTWLGLRDSKTREYVNDATIAGQVVLKATGEEVAAFTLNYEADSNGNYYGVLDKLQADNLAPGVEYEVVMNATSGGRDGQRRIPAWAHWHEEGC